MLPTSSLLERTASISLSLGIIVMPKSIESTKLRNHLSSAIAEINEKKDFLNSFAALNYAHGWLDCGASLGVFDVHDSTLFTVD